MSDSPVDFTTTPVRPGRQAAISDRWRRAGLIGLAGSVLVTAVVGVCAVWPPRGSWASVNTATAGPVTATTEDGRHTIADPAHAANKATKSDVRGAIAAVEHYYTVIGHYPTRAINGDNSRGIMPQLDLGGSTPAIQLAVGTRLSYAPYARSYRICATNTRGTGKWFLYNSASGGSIKAIRRPANPAVCA
ncbi:hypothetical protein [Paractinoplanes rishiriensis]|uniref:Uncharacterized protein n=1 Tax=Paractinoplanes rishiriensis TaxID=1050105 RepID=A0A919K9E0_9ACTN|nr:hypothetical protein [Actinoplanes rishiriensis]GIF02165.1 hypothetical protein Ari01nite_96290 [Actinoplanes rishiriensis]